MKNTSLIIDHQEIKRLEHLVSENKSRKLGKVSTTNPYELLRIKDADGEINMVLYKSGKLVYNGSQASRKFLDDVLLREKGYDYILGSDETGKGEWYGPLVVVATALNPEEIVELRLEGVKDSKTMKTPQIIKLASRIMEMEFPRQSILLNPPAYNKLYSDFRSEGKSLNDIMAWAHSRVIRDLLAEIRFEKARVVIDRFDFKKTEDRLRGIDRTTGTNGRGRLKIVQKTGAESEIPVAAASIIAKYLFESAVDGLNEKYEINLRNSEPEDIEVELLPQVAKIHFKNVGRLLK